MTELTYDKAVQKGTILLSLLEQDNPTPSAFTTYSRISDDGYIKIDDEDTDTMLSSLGTCLRALNVSDRLNTRGGKNVIVHHDLNGFNKVNGKAVPVTATFHQVVNREDGVLIAYTNISPTAFNMTAAPDLKYWSDVAFLQYFQPASPPPLSPLRYIIQALISNDDTLAIFERVLANVSLGIRDLSTWPGISFSLPKDKEIIAALLGTPNGGGIARMLAGHRQHLGRKTIEKVTLFCEVLYIEPVPGWVPSMLVEVKDVKETKEMEDNDIKGPE